ncbi:MAG TPA: hypothetical protein DIU29_02380, partial [Candidatus Jacksonbacteria bacterium]|nr:hypothetical protein [Candidatus Jacksonbacteria bacterium]
TARVDAVLDKYLSAIDFFRMESGGKKKIQDWFFGLMAIEIEDVLGLLAHEEALVAAMTSELQARLEFPPHYLRDEQKEIFLLITTSRSLLKSDADFIAYLLIKKWHPAWFTDSSAISRLAMEIWDLKSQIAQYEKHPMFKQLTRIGKQQAVVFWVLDEVLKKYQGEVQDLSFKVFNVVREIYFNLQKKVKRQVWRSFLYLLLTKFILIVLIEMPYDWWRTGQLHQLQSLITVGVPVFLLLILTIGIEVGNQANTKMLIKEVDNLVNNKPTELDVKIALPHERSLARSILFNFFFAVAYGLSYGGLVYFLLRFHFNEVSGFLLMLFVTLVSYMAIRIRYTSERFRILPRRYWFGREALYFFALPVVWTGRWIATRFSQYNIILLIFDLFFEAPYKTLVFVFRDFSDFAREMREDIQ